MTLKVENMVVERIKTFFKRGVTRPPESNQNCIGFYNQDGSFGFTTYGSEMDKERIIKDLGGTGASILGVMKDARARKLAMNSPQPEQPRRF